MGVSPEIDSQNSNTHEHCANDEDTQWNIGINQQLQGAHDEGFVIRGQPAALFEVRFRQGERAREVGRLNEDSVDHAGDVKPAPKWTAAREEPAENHPKNKEKVNGQHDTGQNEVKVSQLSPFDFSLMPCKGKSKIQCQKAKVLTLYTFSC
jgi:hypothetical protein